MTWPIASVRLWHKADVQTALMNVRFEVNSGHDAGVTPLPLMTQTQRRGFMTTGSTNDTIAIRRLIEDWASAVRARNIGGVVAHHTDDVVMFDVPPPVAVRGIGAIRDMVTVLRL